MSSDTSSPPGDELHMARGSIVAEKVAEVVGSWRFISGQAIFLFSWFILNALPWVVHWDPSPWMMANIIMSAEAAFTGPILLIAANVAALRDRLTLKLIAALEQRLITMEEKALYELAALRQENTTLRSDVIQMSADIEELNDNLRQVHVALGELLTRVPAQLIPITPTYPIYPTTAPAPYPYNPIWITTATGTTAVPRT